MGDIRFWLAVLFGTPVFLWVLWLLISRRRHFLAFLLTVPVIELPVLYSYFDYNSCVAGSLKHDGRVSPSYAGETAMLDVVWQPFALFIGLIVFADIYELAAYVHRNRW